MNIVHVCLTGQFNENFTYQDNLLTKYHSLLGHNVSIIAPTLKLSDDGKNENYVNDGEYLINYNIKLIRLPYYLSNKLIFRLRIYKNLYKTLKKLEPDFIFVHGTQFLSIYTVVKFLKNYKKINIVADSHADFYNSAKNWFSLNILHKLIWKKCTKMIEPFCTKIYGVTPVRCDFLDEIYNVDKNKLELLPLAADDFLIREIADNNSKEEIRKKYNIQENEFVIITGGKIDSLKNIHLLISAFLEIKNKFDHLKLIYFGSFSNDLDEKIKETIIKNTDNKFVVNAGWLNSNEINELFFCSDLAVFPGTHSVLWEQAVANKLPCLFNKIKGMHHVNVNGNCIIFDGNSIQEIKISLNKVLTDKNLYAELLKNSILAADYFSYSIQAKKIIYEA